MTAWSIPDLSEVLAAQRRIAAHLRPTPLFTYPALDRSTGARVHVKHENHQPVGAFKVRGGVNLVARLSDEETSARVAASGSTRARWWPTSAAPTRKIGRASCRERV